MDNKNLPMLQVGDVILSSDCLTEMFCCDFATCRGACCIEGDAGAPLTQEEAEELERVLPVIKDSLSRQAQAVIARQGVAYRDSDGDLVTSIVGGRDCVFSRVNEDGLCLCAVEEAYRQGRIDFCKPISCALYPIRERKLNANLVALNYHKWEICKCAVLKGKKEKQRVFEFLKEPLTRRFGESWYNELIDIVKELKAQGLFF